MLSLPCSAQGPSAQACVQDLDALPNFLLENDTGARDHLEQLGQKHFDEALADAKNAALQIRGNATLIQASRKDLESHPNWIIDVRGNGGGSDSSYLPLMPWLMVYEAVIAKTEILATPANIEGWTRICALYAPGDKECEKSTSDGLERMRSAKPGTYVMEDGGNPMDYTRVEHPEPHRPARVAILIDRGCGSSCEEFVLEARQSFSVKLIGQHTYGSLDYSNLRPHDLPSGRRRLWYATTRSTRIPGSMVDVAGIPPDIYLPAAKSEIVERVQIWLEGGSLAPREVK